MEEMANGTAVDSGSAPESVLTSSAQDVQDSVSAPSSDERVFKQADVNEIVKKAKQQAVDQYKRLHVTQPEYAQQKYGDNSLLSNQQNNYQQQYSVDNSQPDIRKIAAEEAQRLRDEWVREAQTQSQAQYAQKVVDTFWYKVTPGKDKYEDFDSVTGDIQLSKFPNTVQLLAEYVDNAPDVLYDLGKDRLKMAQLEQLASMSPEDAVVQIQRLSKALKVNEDAARAKVPNEPLTQMRPTVSGTGNGVLSVRDLRSKYKV